MPISLVEQIIRELQRLSKSERKQKIAEYLKTSSLDFMGVELPDIHRTVKNSIKGLKLEDLPRFMEELWSKRIFEVRLAAIDVLKVYAKKGSLEVAMKLADKWVGEGDTWGIIDPLCSPTIGSMILRDPNIETTLKSWQTSENFWRRRASVLPFLYLALKTQYVPEFNNRILRAVTPHISDEEFFVAKSAGWVLRELSKRDPKIVEEYFKENRKKMSKLVIREGSKKLKSAR
ncbi:MAG: DNA alkylation repair protein [Candidatus Thorarchaeota archaeon]|nr:DNA alkylation repair protein [Candidatus Thorarchaeota archaeon]